MNKKIIILIVALECVFSVFLISFFGPMIEVLNSKVIVQDVYFVDENGERLPDGTSITVNLDQQRDYHLDFEVVTDKATDRAVDIICRPESAVESTEDADGFGFHVLFLDKNVSSVTFIIRAKDSSQRSATITLTKATTDTDIDDLH